MAYRIVPAKESKQNLTPMIDIIFQLLIFFVLTANFVATEEQLQAHLPKDRGSPAHPPVFVDDVEIFLQWDRGHVVCTTKNFRMGKQTAKSWEFAADPNVEQNGDSYTTRTTLRDANDVRHVTYDYGVPDFKEIERYIEFRRDAHRGPNGLPVEVGFSNAVPWQVVVNLIDLCSRLGIRDVALRGEGSD